MESITAFHNDVYRTAAPVGSFSDMLTVAGFGLAGETGEVIDLLKKSLFHGHALDEAKIRDEMGDVLFYLAYLCNALDTTLEQVMEENIAKRRKRYPEGFASARSIHREE